MFEIKFYNEAGAVSFGGGTSESGWRLTAAEGLALPERSFKTARYSNTAGQEITDTVVAARTITLSGDVIIDNNFDTKYEDALKILYLPGTLEINSYGTKRRIGAVCCDFKNNERKGRYFLFTVQFICESPYFEAADAKEEAIYKVIPCLSADFTFPGMFSKRISYSTLSYAGNAETEPMFYISTGSSPQGNLSIINHTSGEKLSLDYTPLVNEFITIDVKERRIYNSDGASLLKYLSDDSFFDGFHLYPGINEIEVLLGTFNENLTVSCKYTERYLEAVV